MASNKDDSDLYGDLYGDEELIVPLDDESNSPVTEKASTSPTADDAFSTATRPSTNTATSAVTPSVSASAALPAKPQTATSAAAAAAAAAADSLSYSAQVAKQFSAYQQTPSQERIQRPPLPDPNASTNAIETHMGGSSKRNGTDRPLRPSEMKDEGKMFIGGLNWDTTDEGLRSYFAQFGKVDACTIMRDPDGRSRGFAFLTFDDAESVSAVVAKDHHILDGKAIDPKRAIPREEHLRNTRYFVGGLSPVTTADSMRAFFSAFGKVVDATVMVDRESGRSKGFGFVTFEDAGNSASFVGKLGLVLDDKEIEVKAAQPRSQREQARSQQTQNSSSGNLEGNDGRGSAQGGAVAGGMSSGFPVASQMNNATSMLYQRMMSQMGGAGGMGNMGMVNPMMMNPMMAGMGGMMGGNMGNMMPGAMAGNMGGNMGGGGMGGNMGGGNMGNVGMGGMGMGMGGGGGMQGMGGGMGAVNPMGMRMGMGMGNGGMGMQGMGMRMGQRLGMGGAGGGGGGMQGMGGGNGMMMGGGMGAGAQRMAMNNGLGPARMSSRGQHNFHPYAR